MQSDEKTNSFLPPTKYVCGCHSKGNNFIEQVKAHIVPHSEDTLLFSQQSES